MEKGENGLSNLLANRMPNLNSLSTNLQHLRADPANNGANNLNQAALMNAFGLTSNLQLPFNLWDNTLISAMSQYMESNPLLNLKQESPSTDNRNHQQNNKILKRSDDEDNLENKCNKDVLDLKMNNSNKRFKASSDSFVHNNSHDHQQLLNNNHNNKLSKDLSFLDNSKSYPCPECHKTFATEVDLKMHIVRHYMQHPYLCSTCGKGFKYEHTLQFHEKTHSNDSASKLNLKNSNKKDDKNNLNLNRKSKYSSTSSKPPSMNHQQLDDDDIPTNLLVNNSKLNHNLNNLNNLNNKNQNLSLFSSNSSSFDFGFPNSVPNIQMKSEKVLIVMVEGVNPTNDQTYTLYKCNICGFAFANLPPVTEHVLTVHSNNQKFNCDKCGANFKFKNELLLHDQLHKAVEQQHQQATSSNKLMLPPLMQNNLMLVNQYLNSNEQIKLDNNNNNNLMLNSNQLNGLHHLNRQQSLQDNLMGLNLTNKNSQRKDSESSQESLNLTTSSSKSNKNGRGSKELRNDELDELSKNIAVVKENITNELGEIEETAPGQFKCRYCDKTFDRIFSVHRHERVHTGFKPCICKVCGKGFSEKRNLRHHIIRFHSDGSGRELLRRVRKDKSMNAEENSEAKRQLKQMEMNILSINSNSFQSNNGSDEEMPNILSMNNGSGLKEKQTNGDHEDSSNHSGEHLTNNSSTNSSKPITRNRRKSSVPYKVPNQMNNSPSNDLLDTEEDEKDDNSSRSDQASIKEDDETYSNDLNE